MKKTLLPLTLTLAFVFAGASMQTQATPDIVALHLETMKKEALDSIPPFPEDELLRGEQED